MHSDSTPTPELVEHRVRAIHAALAWANPEEPYFVHAVAAWSIFAPGIHVHLYATGGFLVKTTSDENATALLAALAVAWKAADR